MKRETNLQVSMGLVFSPCCKGEVEVNIIATCSATCLSFSLMVSSKRWMST